MLRLFLRSAAAGALLMALSGCAGDPVVKMLDDPNSQARLVDLMVADTTIAQTLVTRLLGSSESRAMLLERTLEDGTSSQELMLRVSTDPAFMNGVIGLGMKDPGMREHLMTLLRGMQMAQ